MSKRAPQDERLGPNMCIPCGGQGVVPSFDDEQSYHDCSKCEGTGVCKTPGTEDNKRETSSNQSLL